MLMQSSSLSDLAAGCGSDALKLMIKLLNSSSMLVNFTAEANDKYDIILNIRDELRKNGIVS